MYLHALLLFLSRLLLAQPTLGMNTSTTNITANLAAVTNNSFFVAKPDCQPKCGDITVPYPFGIGNASSSGCSMSPWFNLTCDSTSYVPPKLFLGHIEVLSINPTQVRVRNTVAARCYDQSTGAITHDKPAWMKWGDAWPYTISDTANKFTVVGCDAFALISGRHEGRNFSTGCLSVCSKSADVVAGDCTGIGCCQIKIPNGLKNFEGSLGRVYGQTKDLSFGSYCTYAFLGEQDSFKFNGESDFNDWANFINRTLDNVPVVLDFVIGSQTCAEAKNLSTSSCHDNTSCTDSNSEYYRGYLCSCKNGYKGNPYLSPGCTDIDECDNSGLILNNCHANATCTNTPGSFSCKCVDHYSGDGTANGTGCRPIVPKASQFSALTLGLSFGFLSLLISVTLLYFGIKRRKLIKLREKFFQQNGGLLMKQKISSIDGKSADQSTKFFTAEELKKVTNNYAKDRILGQGGYGVVYKGILPDQCVVAIKKSKVMDVSQVEQFINELLILTQVNHRNVVKVLGCCFESEVPELVYEYISNGTLYQHIHKTLSWLTLDHRLRIAIEAASALSYLHSAASIPIIHRDIKSANILLDSNYVAKIADFGASRLVPLDQTQVSTLVQGTIGYLDPEYLQSSQLTEKSDVYSFGVVLAELLTGKNPICLERSERERNLATYFILSMKENRLSQIWEPRVAREGTSEQLQAIAELVKRCLCLKSEERPLMKEVVMELEHLRKYRKDPWVNQQSHEESESLLSEEAQVDPYTGPPISLSTSTSDISGQYSFNCSMTFPLNSSRY
ncbi:wall-associated receptor kinase 1-like [Rhododendron vialii]|uniref:wall-associated receptor kinase 1-like n=1 Tax=Rhododendron vialii TaxID=182163 RepID=UPI00265EF584|nr:wall-associated receptor kinase 1-like [Rhododendron vialii]